jgi:trimeric autotransporter adhesin
MTGLAPISNEAAVGANSAAARRAADFSSVLNATANAAQTTPPETPGKNVAVPQGNASRGQKASSAQTNQQSSTAASRVGFPAAVPGLLSSALAPNASAPVPPPIPLTTTASSNAAAAESEVHAAENAPIAAQAVAVSTVPAQPVNPPDAPGSKFGSRTLPAAIIGANDLTMAQTDAEQVEAPNAAVSVGGDSSATQSAADAAQSAALPAGAELAATISAAMALGAAGNASHVDAAQAGSAQSDLADSTATAAASDATSLAARAAPSPEAASNVLPVRTGFPSQVPPPPAAVTASARNSQNSRSASQPTLPEAISADAAAVNVGLQKAISDARDKLIEAFGARLQAEISQAPTKATSSADPANGGSGNLAGQNPENSSLNPSALSVAKPSGDAPTGIAATPSGNSNDVEGPGTSNSSSAMEKAAGLISSAIDPAAHVQSSASQQGSSTISSPTNSQPAGTSTASMARPEAPTLQGPQPLPQSLSDIAKAGELYQRVGGSEMHIAMETDLLGAVDLRATMHQSALTATIGVQRADVQALLSNELPALQHALADKNFHVEQISVLNNSVGGRADSNGQQEAPVRNPFTGRERFAANVAGAGANNMEDLRGGSGVSSIAYGWNDDGGRISVHV